MPEANPSTDPVGSLAEEAAKFVKAFGATSPSGGSDGPPSGADHPGADDRGSDDRGSDDRGADEDRVGGSCPACGDRPQTCAVCPVCRTISVVRRVPPETVASIADAVGLVSTALHEWSDHLRSQQSSTGSTRRDTAGAQRAETSADAHGDDAAGTFEERTP